MNKKQLLSAMLIIGLAQTSAVYADGIFHTIIGPDGRPMVVQRPDLPVKKRATVTDLKKSAPASTAQTPSPSYLDPKREAHVQDIVRELSGKKPSQIVKGVALEEQQKQVQTNTITQESSPKALSNDVNKADDIRPKSAKQSVNSQQGVLPAVIHKQIPSAQGVASDESKGVTENRPLKSEVVEQSAIKQQASQKAVVQVPPMPEIVQDKKHSELSTIDGDTYVNNEYLEEKEFNLEGKKRFYAMPEGVIDPKTGATRMQMVEREKGVGQSVIDNLFKKNRTVDEKPIVLSTSYYRVSKADAVEGLGQQCFSQKELKKSKQLKAQQDTNLWPRAPITAQFDFEVVKLEPSIKNIEIHSYASKQNKPVFYWPFAVFLDHQGCVMEGAGGYKNNDADSNHLYREKIEGVIQVPSGTTYLLLTPLATAIDVDERVLSNQGQLKLIAIR